MNVKLDDNQSLLSATGRFGHSIPTYDDGWGTLYIARDSMGIVGIVRAQTYVDAWSIVEDEFLPSADDEAFEKDFEDMTDHEQACWDEAYGYRPNGIGGPTPEKDNGVYAKDLNGESLEPLTFKMLDEWEITLDVKTDWDNIREDLVETLVTDTHGQFIPQIFATGICTKEMFDHQEAPVKLAIAELMEPDSPSSEYYWDNWDTILNCFQFNGLNLYQNGDLVWVNTNRLDALLECYGIDDVDVVTENLLL